MTYECPAVDPLFGACQLGPHAMGTKHEADGCTWFGDDDDDDVYAEFNQVANPFLADQ